MNRYRSMRSYENLQKVIFEGVGEYSIPVLRPVRDLPVDNWIGFNFAKGCDDPKAHGVHFFLDDYQFERFWNDPFRYLGRLKLFAGVIEPDFSTCLDFPVALKAYSVYRNQALGSFLQRNGILCVPNVRCEPGLPWMLDGTPRRSSIAIGARAAIKKPSDREALMNAARYAVEVLEPTEIIWYGSTSYGIGDWLLSLGVPIHVCPARVRG